VKKVLLNDKELVEIAQNCARILDDKKAKDIILMDLRGVNNYLDYFLLATGNSLIHCRSLAKEIQKILKNMQFEKRNRDNFDSEWIVLDYNEIVIHIFTQESRNFYQLEKLWADADTLNF
jgi:ribosome-associated protein